MLNEIKEGHIQKRKVMQQKIMQFRAVSLPVKLK